ncbi:MAG: alpha/beta hydrolase fold domain-containing protein [Pseudomonadota bacterium]
MSNQISDLEVLAFIAEVDAFYPPDAVALSIEEQRARYDRMAAHFLAPRPSGMETRDSRIADVACRHYPGGAPRVVFFHGGGFVVGGLDSHDDVCAEIAHRTGLAVTAVDYRLGPEHLHPAAFDDALAVTRALLGEGPVILCGDSGGGTLAASTAWALRGDGRVSGQALIYPALGGERLGLPSYTAQAEAPLLSTRDVQAYARLRAGGAPPLEDPSFAVFAATGLSGIAPAFISAAACDPLCDDGPEYQRRLAAEGIAVDCVVEPQLPHMWLRARHRSARAGAAFDRVIAGIATLAAHPSS